MLTCTATLVGTGPISFSAPIRSVRETGENHDAFEIRTWRERMHIDPQTGRLFIPPASLKNALVGVSKYLQESVPGKRMATYSKYFLSGVLVTEPLILVNAKTDQPFTEADVIEDRLFCSSDGVRGGPKKVWKSFPSLVGWKAEASIILIDPILVANPDKVREYVEHAGKFVGMGRMRPAMGGWYGRWEVENFNTPKIAAKKKTA